MTLNGSNKSDTPAGFVKLANANETLTATFNYSGNQTGKIYIDGIMDSWSGNKSKTMYSGKSSTTSNGNFKLTVNGTAVDFSDKKSTTFETLFGSGSNATLGSSYSQQAEVEIGSMSLKNGENTIVFGLANDAIGYIVPDNDYILCFDFDKHYHELFSAGKNTASFLMNELVKIKEEIS